MQKKSNGWRRFYRRLRIYLPLSIFLLVLMIVFLPIRGGWLASLVEDQILKRTDIPISIDSARVHLWSGEIGLDGLSVPVTEDESDEPFSIEAIRLYGSFGDLMSGEGEYPRRIEIRSPDGMTVQRDSEGIKAEGPLYNLVRAIIHLSQQSDESESNKKSDPPAFTPEIVLSNLQIRIEDKTEDRTAEVFLQSLELSQRRASSEPWFCDFNGIVRTDSTGSFSATANYLPEEKIAQLDFEFDGLEYSKQIEGIPFLLNAEGLGLEIELDHSREDEWQLSTELSGDLVEITDTRPGGILFPNRDMKIRTDLVLMPDDQKVRDWSFRILAPDTHIDGAGSFPGESQTDGEASIAVRRIPAVTTRVLQDWGRSQDITFDRGSTSTLALDLTASGDFAKPENLDFEEKLKTTGWSIQPSELKSPIELSRINLSIQNDVMELKDLDVRYKDVSAIIDATIQNWQSPKPDIGINLALDGSGSGLLEMARQQKLIDDQIRDLSLPFQTELSASFTAKRSPENEAFPWSVDLDSGTTDLTGNLTWQQGSVAIRELVYPIEFNGGRIDFSESDVNLAWIRARYRDLDLDGNVSITRTGGTWNSDTEFRANLGIDTDIQKFLGTLRSELGMNLIQFPITGNATITSELSGKLLTPSDWNFDVTAILENIAAELPVPYTTVDVSDGYLSLELSQDSVSVPAYSMTLNDRLKVAGNLTASDESIETEVQISGQSIVLSEILRKEMKEMVLEGEFDSQSKITLTPRGKLLNGRTLIERWAVSLAAASAINPKGFIHIHEESPFRLEADGKIIPIADVGVFHRKMPHAVRNVRGGVSLDETGFQFSDTLVDIGPAKDIKVNGFVQLGHVAGKVIVDFDISGRALDFNDWKGNWGRREWATPTFVVPSYGGPDTRTEKNVTTVYVDVDIRDSAFLSVKASDVKASLIYDAWRFQENTASFKLHSADVYDGTISGEAAITFPRRSQTDDTRALFTTQLRPRQVEMRKFLNDLRNTEHSVRGRVTGTANISGRIDDYPSWTGDADFRMINSRFIGEQSFVWLTSALNFGDPEEQSDTTITGFCTMENELISFPSIQVESSDILMLSNGSIDHDGYIDFLVTVDLFRDQLDGIPIIGNINRFLNNIQRNLVSYRVTGKMYAPEIDAIPLADNNMSFFEEGRRRIFDQIRTRN